MIILIINLYLGAEMILTAAEKENVMCASTLRYEILHNVAWFLSLPKKSEHKTNISSAVDILWFFIGNVVVGIFVKYISG